jgi:PmbA protein
VLIEHGRLTSYVYDTVSARRAGTVSTGSAVRGGMGATPTAGCRALALDTGDRSLEELLALVGDGIYVTELQGVHSGVNPISGDFSVGVTGFVIRNGQLAEPIREATVASTLQRMLLDVIAVGRDVEWLPGSAAGVPLAISGISVSGA